MSIIGRIPKPKMIQNLSLTDPKAWNPSLWNMIGSQSISGENVTEETALTYSAVWNAVALIGGTIGALPLHLMQRKGDEKKIAMQAYDAYLDTKAAYTEEDWGKFQTAHGDIAKFVEGAFCIALLT